MPATDDSKPILVLYTGGTIGMVPSDVSDPHSTLVPGSWDRFLPWVPQIVSLGITIRQTSIEHPTDSSELTSCEWREMASIIEREYGQCAGVVILHGTDTMAYTATALSFMLRNLNKPVIVTGSQLPISAPGTDAVQNLVNALRIAAGPAVGIALVPEVCLYFREQLLRGCRATKVSANEYSAFESPNFPPLGVVDQRVLIHAERLRQASDRPLSVHTELADGVTVLQMTPGLDAKLLRTCLELDTVKGVVLRTFGAGNLPTRTGLVEVLEAAIAGGTTIINVTQCLRGRVEQGRYQGSARLRSIGVIDGGDMTTEAAVIKLQFALAEHSGDREAIRKSILHNCVGERSHP